MQLFVGRSYTLTGIQDEKSWNLVCWQNAHLFEFQEELIDGAFSYLYAGLCMMLQISIFQTLWCIRKQVQILLPGRVVFTGLGWDQKISQADAAGPQTSPWIGRYRVGVLNSGCMLWGNLKGIQMSRSHFRSTESESLGMWFGHCYFFFFFLLFPKCHGICWSHNPPVWWYLETGSLGGKWVWMKWWGEAFMVALALISMALTRGDTRKLALSLCQVRQSEKAAV